MPVLYWYFFKVELGNSREKGKFSLFLMVKMYDISFNQQLLVRLCSMKLGKLVRTIKVIPSKWYYPGN